MEPLSETPSPSVTVPAMFSVLQCERKIILVAFCISCIVSFVATSLAIGLFVSEKKAEQNTAVSPPLRAEPAILDFQNVAEGVQEGVIYLSNPSNKVSHCSLPRAVVLAVSWNFPAASLAPVKSWR